MDEPDDSEVGYELVMPFVVCKSQGGPYDDAAFCAGVRFAQFKAALDIHQALGVAGTVRQYVEPALVPQLDLLAMHHSMTLTVTPWDGHPDWVLAEIGPQL